MPPTEGPSGEPLDEPDPVERAWQDLIDNYGERADLSDVDTVIADPPGDEPTARVTLERDPAAGTHSIDPPEVWRGTTGPTYDDLDEPFRPSEPTRLPRLAPLPLAGWVGVLGVPALVIVLGIAHLSPPPFVSAAMIAWFIAGFGYLIYTMPTRSQRDPGDDGSRL